jgi:putative DNA-invertase from lambdoid prophage Rac
MAQMTDSTGEMVAESGGTFGKARRAGLYNRRSTMSQGDPSAAMADLRTAAEQRGFRVALEIAETGSGARNDRPGLQRILGAARRGKLSAVIVARLDRFGRSSLDLLANIRTLTDAGVEFIAIEQGLHVRPHGDAMSQLLLTVLSGVAEFERSIIRDRVIEGQRRAVERGIKLGRPRGEGPSATAVRKLRRAGKSWSQIATALGCKVAMARRRFAESARE